MPKLELQIAEAWVAGGERHFIVEFWKEGHGLQRPTFKFPKDTPDAECFAIMRQEIEAQEKLGRKPRKKPQIKKFVGKKI